MEIIEARSPEEMARAYSLLLQLYPVEKYLHMGADVFRSTLDEMCEEGYRQILLVEDGKCIAMSGFNITMRLYIGRVMRVHHIIIDEAYRGKGLTKILMPWLENEAKKNAAKALILDSSIEKSDNHDFYHHVGFQEYAKHFVKWV